LYGKEKFTGEELLVVADLKLSFSMPYTSDEYSQFSGGTACLFSLWLTALWFAVLF
jgi:hypothetical protein